MKKLLLLWFLISFFSFVSCQKLDDDDTNIAVPPSIETPNIPINEIANIIRFDKGIPNTQEIKTLIEEKYNINYEETYRSLVESERLNIILKNGINARINNQNLTDSIPILTIDGTQSFLLVSPLVKQYIDKINQILPSDETDDEYQINYDLINEKVYQLKVSIEGNGRLTQKEKQFLALSLNTLKENLSSIVGYVKRELDGPFANDTLINGRVNGGFKKIWRKVRSVAISVAVITAVTFATTGPIGAAIVGSLVLIATSYDVIKKDKCWFAMQCDGAWAQKCSTGDCWDPNNAGGIGSGGTSNPTNPNIDEDLKKIWYNLKESYTCDAGGRCMVRPGSLTFKVMDEWAQQNGVYDEIKRKFPNSTQSTQWQQYKCRLGRIFEDAAMRSLRIQIRQRPVYDRENLEARPDGIFTSGVTVQEVINGKKTRVHYFWKEGALVDAKLSQYEEICFYPNTVNNRQLEIMINYLSENTKAHTTTNDYQAVMELGTAITKRATDYRAAILHIVTLAGATLDTRIKDYATLKHVELWHSETDVVSDILDNYYLEVRDPKVENPRGIEVGKYYYMGGKPAEINWSKP
jgi:hypothetical protein